METDYSTSPLDDLNVLIQYFIHSHHISSEGCWRRRFHKITAKLSNKVTWEVCVSFFAEAVFQLSNCS